MTLCFSPAVYDLLDSPDCLPNLLQGNLKNKGRDEAFLLSSFQLQSKAPTPLYSIVNPKDSSKYLELSVQAKLSKGACDRPASTSPSTCFPSSVSYSHFPPLPVTLRYQKTDGRFATTSFNHPSLADGRDHHVMLHASGLQRGPPRLNIYIDCWLAHTMNDLPAAFGALAPGSNTVALRSLPIVGQVGAYVRTSLQEHSPSDWSLSSFPVQG